MKAVNLINFEGPRSWKLVSHSTTNLQPDEVRVKVKAASLNYRDLMVSRGLYNPQLPLPAVPISDAAGEVIEVGAAVSDLVVGDRVATTFFQDWIEGPLKPVYFQGALGGEAPGVLAQEIVLKSRGLIRFPDHLSFHEASTLPCAALTAWNALFELGSLQPNQTVLIQGTGGVSLFALQFAKLAGARVIATTSGDEKAELLREMGATAVVNYKKNPRWGHAVQDLTAGVGVDLVVEVGGAGTLEQSLQAIATGGQISAIGVLTGLDALTPLFPLLVRQVKMQGVFVGSKAMFERMNSAIEFHRLRPLVDRVFPLDEAAEALEYLASGSHRGKVVIEVG